MTSLDLEQTFVREFFDNHCTADPRASLMSSELCDAFNLWVHGEWKQGRQIARMLSPNAFGRLLVKMGVKRRIKNGRTFVDGIQPNRRPSSVAPTNPPE